MKRAIFAFSLGYCLFVLWNLALMMPIVEAPPVVESRMPGR